NGMLIVLAREVQQAETPEEVAKACRRSPSLAKALLDSGAHPHHVTRMISSVCDAACVKLIALAEEKFGVSPVPFAFIALGSHGRQEMTLASDQDNAIIYKQPSNSELIPQIEEHMNNIGSFVCSWLNEAGYPFCNGDIMAKNPKWCKPIEVWKKYFTDWISLPDSQQLLRFSIFFDFRTVCGDVELANDLRNYIFEVLNNTQSFYPHFAQNSLLFKPPTRIFGRVISGGVSGESSGQLDLKDAVMPIVNFARLYALNKEIEDTNTLERIYSLAALGVIRESSSQDIAMAYDFLIKLRLQNQAESLSSNSPIDNTISYRKLAQLEQTLLNQSFAQITAIQKRISYDYLGGTV
ncbi:MAG: DUF294 nucleotidyltransferase-like domain-containing protein, partial [Armatimonadota bacterium]